MDQIHGELSRPRSRGTRREQKRGRISRRRRDFRRREGALKAVLETEIDDSFRVLFVPDARNRIAMLLCGKTGDLGLKVLTIFYRRLHSYYGALLDEENGE